MRKYKLLTSILTVLLITLLLTSSGSAAGPERLWAAEFTYDVPSGTWDVGDHPYHFEFAWTEPEPGTSVGDTAEFTVSSDAPLYPGFVLLRGSYVLAQVSDQNGQRCEIIGAFLHPDQPTRFHIGWLTDEPMTRREARAHFESMTVKVVWDEGSSAELVRRRILPFFSQERWRKQLCVWTVRPQTKDTADVVFYNGVILTLNANQPQAQAVAVREDRILAVGSNASVLALQGPRTRVVDLAGRTLLPGFVDGHTHILAFPDRMNRTLDEAQETALRYGFTTVNEMWADQPLLDELMLAEQTGRLRLRVNVFATYNDGILDENGNKVFVMAWYPGNDPILDSNRMLRIPGIKVFVDGASAPGRGCPALSEPYPPEVRETDWFRDVCGSDRGDLYWSQEEINQVVADAQAAGYRVAFHAMGDRAIETTLDAIEFALDGQPNELIRHQIQHNSLIRPDLFQRYVDLDALASVRGYFNTCDQDSYVTSFGPDRFEWAANRYALPGLGVHAYLETDFGWTVDPADTSSSRNPNPPLHLYGLVTLQQVNTDGTICIPEPWLALNEISVEQALRMMTIEPAYAVSQEDVIGSLEPGKYADLIILSDNPLTIDPNTIKDLEVLMTMVGGKAEYCGPELLLLQPELCP